MHTRTVRSSRSQSQKHTVTNPTNQERKSPPQRVDKFAYPGAKLRLLSLVHMHHGEKKFLLVVLKFTMQTILFH